MNERLHADVLKQLNPVELPLVKPYLEKFDKVRVCRVRMPVCLCSSGSAEAY
jgi:hypothetical protein